MTLSVEKPHHPASSAIGLASLIACGAAALGFSLYPAADLQFSALFYRPAAGFFLADASAVRFLYKSVEVVVPLYVLALITAGFLKRPPFGLTGKKITFLLLVLALGPGLVVNVLLKNHWGRARPRQIEAFGGTRQFTPPLVISDQCAANCSFVSGHAAAGFYFTALAMVADSRRRRIMTGAIAYGTLVGVARIAQGGHFASDVVFAFLVVYLIAWGLYRLMFLAGPFLRATKR